MSRYRLFFSFLLSVLMVFFTLIDSAQAAGRASRGASLSGDSSLGFGLSFISANQKDLNTAIDSANASANGPVTTKNFSSAYELYAQYSFRFTGTIFGLVFRPSYFTQTTTGSGTNGAYDYKLTGLTFFSILRLYPLENSFMKFFVQGGLGWGKLSGDVSTGTGNSIAFEGNQFGALAGMGADFCFTGSHCLTIEGNVRYLPIERNLASSSSGTVTGIDSTVSSGKEVEINGLDLATTMSGVQGVIAYTYYY